MNRIWQQLFGQGIVKTAEDFGLQGDRPTHPELLDWLAVSFAAKTAPDQSPQVDRLGWDVKAFLRLVLSSATYQQQSNMSAALVESDPENRLLAHGPRFRLPSWMIRDQALSASGLLVEQVGGSPVRPYQPEGIWEEATFGNIRYVQDHGSALYRRSLYIFWRRIVGPTMFFDVANRQTCQVKVGRTNTPLHALVTLNDVTFVEAARAMAEELIRESEDDSDRLINGFRRCTSRRPSDRELANLNEALRRLRKNFAEDLDSAKALIKTGESKSDDRIDPIELAAFTSIASLLLNLDETLTKE